MLCFWRLRLKNNPLETAQITPYYPIRPPIFPIRRIPLASPLTNWQTIGAERLRHVLLGVVRWKWPRGILFGGLPLSTQIGLVG